MLNGSKDNNTQNCSAYAKVNYTLNQVSNILSLAFERGFMDFTALRVLKDECSIEAGAQFKATYLPRLDEMGDIDKLDKRTKEAVISEIRGELVSLENRGYTLANLWASLVKISFMEGEVIDLKNKEVKSCWKNFSKKLKSIFEECHKQEVNFLRDNFSLDAMQRKKIEQCLLEFIYELVQIGQEQSAKTLHNIFYFLNSCTKSPSTTLVTDKDISILIRPTLLRGLKLEHKLYTVKTTESRDYLFPEWCFMGTLAQVAMNMREFKIKYEDELYLKEEQEDRALLPILRSFKSLILSGPTSPSQNDAMEETYTDKEIVKFVLENNVSKLSIILQNNPSLVNSVKGIFNRSLLHMAAMNGYDTLVRLMLSYGANILEADRIGQLAIHYAIKGQNKVCVERLLQADVCRATINAQTQNGNTPLHLLASALVCGEHYESILALLTEYGANFFLKNHEKLRETPIKSAESHQRRDLFKKALQKRSSPLIESNGGKSRMGY